MRFCVPTTYGLRVPLLLVTGAKPATRGEENHLLTGAALGFFQPLGGFSRDTAS